MELHSSLQRIITYLVLPNEELRAQRLHEMEELQESEEGKLTLEHDCRHRGPGMI